MTPLHRLCPRDTSCWSLSGVLSVGGDGLDLLRELIVKNAQANGVVPGQ